MALWIASVIKSGLKGVSDQFETVVTHASTEIEAQHIIAQQEWPQSYWKEGKSVTRILQIFRAD